MARETYQPCGLEFFDAAGRQMLFVTDDEPRESLRGWLLYWSEPYGNWVTLRKATKDDRARLNDLGHATLTPRQCRRQADG